MSLFAGLHTQTITIEPFSAADSSGFGGGATYSAAKSYACRVEWKQRRVVDENGDERLSRGRAIISGDIDPTIDLRARLTLPSGLVPTNPPIVAIEHSPDPIGLTASTVVYF